MNKQPKTKPRYNLWQNTCWMVKLGWKERWQVVALTAVIPLLDLCTKLLDLYSAPTILRQIEEHAPLARLVGVVFFFACGMGTVHGLFRWCMSARYPAKVELRMNIFARLQQKAMTLSLPQVEDPAVQDKLEAGRLQCSNNRSATEGFWPNGEDVIRDVLGFGLYLGMLASLSPALAAVAVVTALAGALASRQTNVWADSHRDEQASVRRQFYEFNRTASDRALGKDLRLFGLKTWVESIAENMLRLMDDFEKKRSLRLLMADGAGFFAALLRNGAAYWYLISMVLEQGLPASSFLLYFGVVGRFADLVTNILTGLVTMHRHSLKLCAVREALDLPDLFPAGQGKPLPVEPDARHRLELRDVSFRYPGGETDALSHINLTIAPGEKLAIVGLNGAGKTTLIKLLCGFYDPTEGQVLLDGQDIRQYDRRDYYRHFAGVFQDYSLLEIPIRDNIVPFGQPCDQARLEDCMEKAGLTQKIASLPKGYDTPYGRQVYLDGTDFSGGETQRLLLARALYRNSPILVLDEPTAALDPLAEHDMYMKYDAMCAGKTAVYISHRLASTRFCDRIILLEQGGIAEEGTHDALLDAGGKYAQLFQIQSRYYEKGGEFREQIG